MHNIYEFVCDELEKIDKKAKSGDLSTKEIEMLEDLTKIKKNILTIEAMEGSEDEYSNRYSRRYEDGMSYRNDGSSYRGGSSYTRDGRGRGSNARRDSRGRYSSYSEAKEDVVEDLHELMQKADGSMRRKIENVINKMEDM